MAHSFVHGVSKECRNLNPEVKANALNRHVTSLLPQVPCESPSALLQAKGCKVDVLSAQHTTKEPQNRTTLGWPVSPISFSLKPGALSCEHSDQSCVSTNDPHPESSDPFRWSERKVFLCGLLESEPL